MGENQSPQARFFPAKRLCYFLVNIRHHSKAQTFFPWTDFPPKDLRVFFLTKVFPTKRPTFFFQIVPRPFKSANYAIDGFWRNHGSLTRYFSLTRESKEVWETLFNSMHVLNLLASPLVQIWKKRKRNHLMTCFREFSSEKWSLSALLRKFSYHLHSTSICIIYTLLDRIFTALVTIN